jgi:hypothetical protein
MQKKVAAIAARLAASVDAWPGVVAVLLGENAEVETIDPYFSIDLAVCHADGLPEEPERKRDFGSPPGFEYSPHLMADLFLVEELPVRVSYRSRQRIEALVERAEQGEWVFRDETTHALYRIQNGTMLRDAQGWLARSRERLARVPDTFWGHLKEGSRIALDRALIDVGAAVYRRDYLFYQLSAARFLQSLCSFLFALNRRFEPGYPMLFERITQLSKLPDEFAGRLDGLVRPDVEITPARRYEICQLIARSLSYL